MRRCLVPLVLLATSALARPAHAQFFDVFGTLFENVNAIVFYGQTGVLLDQTAVEGKLAGVGVSGMGAEVLINLPSYGNTDFELALGASVAQGFASTEPTLDLRATLRTLPSVHVYASRLGLPPGSPFVPYFGAGFGVADLWNARGYAPDGTIYPVSAETFELSATAGTYVNTGALRGLYAELGYRRRSFESLVWDAERLPEGWPRAFDASSVVLNVGWQFFITHSKVDG